MSTPAVRHFTRFVLRPQDEQLTPLELWFEDKQLPGGLFALGRLFEVVCGPAVRVTAIDEYDCYEQPDSAYDVHAGTAFATSREVLEPSPMTADIDRTEVHEMIIQWIGEDRARIINAAIDRKYRSEVWGSLWHANTCACHGHRALTRPRSVLGGCLSYQRGLSKPFLLSHSSRASMVMPLLVSGSRRFRSRLWTASLSRYMSDTGTLTFSCIVRSGSGVPAGFAGPLGSIMAWLVRVPDGVWAGMSLAALW